MYFNVKHVSCIQQVALEVSLPGNHENGLLIKWQHTPKPFPPAFLCLPLSLSSYLVNLNISVFTSCLL